MCTAEHLDVCRCPATKGAELAPQAQLEWLLLCCAISSSGPAFDIRSTDVTTKHPADQQVAPTLHTITDHDLPDCLVTD
jgi:hypothetical protein